MFHAIELADTSSRRSTRMPRREQMQARGRTRRSRRRGGNLISTQVLRRRPIRFSQSGGGRGVQLVPGLLADTSRVRRARRRGVLGGAVSCSLLAAWRLLRGGLCVDVRVGRGGGGSVRSEYHHRKVPRPAARGRRSARSRSAELLRRDVRVGLGRARMRSSSASATARAKEKFSSEVLTCEDLHARRERSCRDPLNAVQSSLQIHLQQLVDPRIIAARA